VLPPNRSIIRTGSRDSKAQRNKKPRRFTEVKRRGRNREEAVGLLWGIKKIRQSRSQVFNKPLAIGKTEQTSAATSSFTGDHTHFQVHVQQMFPKVEKKFGADLCPIGATRRYYLAHKVLRSSTLPR
jgi:hypothetical protein